MTREKDKGQTSLDQANGAKLVEEEGSKEDRGVENEGRGCKGGGSQLEISLHMTWCVVIEATTPLMDGVGWWWPFVAPPLLSPTTHNSVHPLVFNEIPDAVTNPPDSLRCIHFYSSKIGLIDLLLGGCTRLFQLWICIKSFWNVNVVDRMLRSLSSKLQRVSPRKNNCKKKNKKKKPNQVSESCLIELQLSTYH